MWGPRVFSFIVFYLNAIWCAFFTTQAHLAQEELLLLLLLLLLLEVVYLIIK
jgi:hypothetical protein